MKALPVCVAYAWVIGAGVLLAGPTVTKVEPPNWWSGHSINPVRLLIRGTGLTNAAVTAPSGLQASNVRVNDRGTYLFVSLNVPADTSPGDYPLRIKTAQGSASAPFRIEPPLAPEGRFQGFSPDDVIYLIMPDRFANGDTTNDDPAISRGAFGRNASRLYHGGDLQGIINHLPYLKQLGVTAIWMTPVYDNTNQTYTSAFAHGAKVSDYHGYGAIDYYGVDEHFGDLPLFRKLVDTAHAMHIKIIQDQVANHVSPVHPWVKDPPTPTWFNGTVARHLKETFALWNLIDPYAPESLYLPVFQGWFGDFLPDLNQNDPETATYEIQNALWWVGSTGLDGIRQDTLPYVPRTFWSAWSAALKRQYPNIRVVGEVLDQNPVVVSYFQSGAKRLGHEGAGSIDSGIDTVFDYPVYFSIRDTLARGKKLENLFKTAANDALYPNPSALVTIFGDHDVARFLEEPGASMERLKLAFAFLLTFRGTPVIYYGDEIGMRGGDDPDNRRDFPGGWKEDASNAFEATGRNPAEADLFNYVAKLTALRSKESALRRGAMVNLAEADQAWVYARQDRDRLAVIALNNDSKPTDILIHLDRAIQSLQNALEEGPALKLQDGTGTIHLPAVSAAIYINR